MVFTGLRMLQELTCVSLFLNYELVLVVFLNFLQAFWLHYLPAIRTHGILCHLARK